MSFQSDGGNFLLFPIRIPLAVQQERGELLVQRNDKLDDAEESLKKGTSVLSCKCFIIIRWAKEVCKVWNRGSINWWCTF